MDSVPLLRENAGRLLCDCLGKLRPDICRRGTDQDLLPGEILVFSEEGVESRREHCARRNRRPVYLNIFILQDRTLSLIRSLYQQQEFRLGNY